MRNFLLKAVELALYLVLLGRGGDFLWAGFGRFIKQYIFALVIFFLNLMPIVNLAIMIVCGICAKYLVCKSFVESLNMQNDAFLVSNGGRNIWVMWLAVIVCLIILLRLIFDSKEQGVFVMNAKCYEI